MDKLLTLELNNPTLGYNPSSAACCEFMKQFLHSPEPPLRPQKQAEQIPLLRGTLTRQHRPHMGPAWNRAHHALLGQHFLKRKWKPAYSSFEQVKKYKQFTEAQILSC